MPKLKKLIEAVTKEAAGPGLNIGFVSAQTALAHYLEIRAEAIDKIVELLGKANCPACYELGPLYSDTGRECQFCYDRTAVLEEFK